MPRLTAAQVAQVCADAGFRGSALTNAVAVALAESGGNTQAVHTNLDSHRSRDRGLFQINSYWHKEVTDAQAFDPAQNAAAAYRISAGGTSWSPWATWPVLAAAQVPVAKVAVARLGQVQTVAAGGNGGGGSWTDDGDVQVPDSPDLSEVIPGIPDSIPNPLGAFNSLEDSVGAIAGAVVKVGAWVADPHNWLRVAYVTTGAMGVLIALAMIGKSGAAGESASGAVKSAGKAAKGAAEAAVVVA